MQFICPTRTAFVRCWQFLSVCNTGFARRAPRNGLGSRQGDHLHREGCADHLVDLTPSDTRRKRFHCDYWSAFSGAFLDSEWPFRNSLVTLPRCIMVHRVRRLRKDLSLWTPRKLGRLDNFASAPISYDPFVMECRRRLDGG